MSFGNGICAWPRPATSTKSSAPPSIAQSTTSRTTSGNG